MQKCLCSLLAVLVLFSCEEECFICEQEDILGQWVQNKDSRNKLNIEEVIYTFRNIGLVSLYQKGGLIDGAISNDVIPRHGGMFRFEKETDRIVFFFNKKENITNVVPATESTINWIIKGENPPNITVDITDYKDSLLASNVVLEKQ